METYKFQYFLFMLNLLFILCFSNTKKNNEMLFKNRNVMNKKKTKNKMGKDTFRRKITKSSDLPMFLAEDIIQVYHMRTKNLPFIRTTFGVFDAHTSGMAFRCERTDTIITLEFLPSNNSKVFLPQLLSHSSSSGNTNNRLIWNKQAALWYSNYIDMTYWQTSTYLADINGNVMSHFTGWLDTFMKSSSFYIPQTVCAVSSLEAIKKSPLLPSNNPKCYISARTSDSFVQSVLQKLAHLAVNMKPLTPPPVTEIVMVSSTTPEDVFLESGAITSQLGQDIVDYYLMLEQCMREVLNIGSAMNNGSTRLSGSNGNGKYSAVVSQCMKGVPVGYIHLGRDHYVKITPPSIIKHPTMTYASVYEGTQAVPIRMAITAPGPSVYDRIIGLCLLLSVILGIILSLQKLRLIELCTSDAHSHDSSRKRSKRRISSNVPVEGGYSTSSELPRYVEWAWMSNNSNNNNNHNHNSGYNRSSSGINNLMNNKNPDDSDNTVDIGMASHRHTTPVGKAGHEWFGSNNTHGTVNSVSSISHGTPASIHSSGSHNSSINGSRISNTRTTSMPMHNEVNELVSVVIDEKDLTTGSNVVYSQLQINEDL